LFHPKGKKFPGTGGHSERYPSLLILKKEKKMAPSDKVQGKYLLQAHCSILLSGGILSFLASVILDVSIRLLNRILPDRDLQTACVAVQPSKGRLK
jgi:hypothetical protein